MTSAATSGTNALRGQITARQAVLTGWLLCGVLDITAACLQAWMQAGRAPADVLRGVASALWGRAAMTAGPGMAAIGVVMHFTVALTWPQLAIHMVCVGPPIAWGVRRGPVKS